MEKNNKKAKDFYAVVSAIAQFIEKADSAETPASWANPAKDADIAGQIRKDVVNYGS